LIFVIWLCQKKFMSDCHDTWDFILWKLKTSFQAILLGDYIIAYQSHIKIEDFCQSLGTLSEFVSNRMKFDSCLCPIQKRRPLRQRDVRVTACATALSVSMCGRDPKPMSTYYCCTSPSRTYKSMYNCIDQWFSQEKLPICMY
jgi:hypothetical protein